MATVLETSHKAGDWVCCWWCCNGFDTPSFSIPSEYNERRDRYTLFGIFCSPACGKAYMIKERGGDMGLRAHWFSRLLSRHYKIKGVVHAAPPRQALRMFGGPMSIEEFRSGSQSVRQSVPPHDPGVCVLHVPQADRKKRARPKETEPRPVSNKQQYTQATIKAFIK